MKSLSLFVGVLLCLPAPAFPATQTMVATRGGSAADATDAFIPSVVGDAGTLVDVTAGAGGALVTTFASIANMLPEAYTNEARPGLFRFFPGTDTRKALQPNATVERAGNPVPPANGSGAVANDQSLRSGSRPTGRNFLRNRNTCPFLLERSETCAEFWHLRW
jgi:hypothetical protein